MDCMKDWTFFVLATHLIGMTQGNVELSDHIFVAASNSYPIILQLLEKYANT
jgi:hypothetical protein